MGRPKINFGSCTQCEKEAVTKQLCSAHYRKLYYSLNRDKENAARAQFNRVNKEKMAFRKRTREKIDVNYKIANRLRHRLSTAIKGGGSINYLGCSVEDFKKYIESQFQPGMTWDNWTSYGWHIDHIIPLSTLDLTVQDNLIKACHYSNLRPLWWNENLGRRYGRS